MNFIYETLAMKNHITRKIFKANIYLVFLIVIISMVAMSETTMAKSLYVIANRKANPQPVQAYDIGLDGTLTFQTELSTPRRLIGAVGMAIDSDAGYLFLTYESTNEILLVDAKKMTTRRDIVTVPNANNLAGIVYDHDKGLLYCVARATRRLFVSR